MAKIKNKYAKELMDFIREYQVITVAVAFVMGAATNNLVKSFIDGIFMPLLNPLLKTGDWKESILQIGAVKLQWGLFVSAFLNFIILGLVVFIIIKKLIKYEPKK